VFARVSMYEIPVENSAAATDAFRRALDEIRTMGGLVEGYTLVHADSGRVITLTLWETANAMEASRVTASRLRTEALHTVDGTLLSTEEYEVAAREVGA
jgi:heme-degrading monooxygenase HmoA